MRLALALIPHIAPLSSRNKRRLTAWMISFLLLSSTAWGLELRASVAYLPSLAESETQGAYIELVKAIDDVYADGTISITVFPFARSLWSVANDQADFHIPMLRVPRSAEGDAPVRLMNKPIGEVCIVLYSHRDMRLTPQQLYRYPPGDNYPYRLSTIRGAAQFASLPLTEVNRIELAFKQIALKRIDGFLMAQEEADHVLRELNLQEIHRERHACYDEVMVIPDSEAGKRTEAILERALFTLEEHGRLQQLYRNIHRPFQDWQTYEPGPE